MACAMATGSWARVTAEASSTASHPSSMASAASDAVPMPASSTTGTPAREAISSMLWGFRMPSPVPIGAPRGITALAPASSRRSASTGSSDVYAKTLKPRRTSFSVASSSSTPSGSRVSSSEMISSLTQSVSSASRPSSAVSSASRAV